MHFLLLLHTVVLMLPTTYSESDPRENTQALKSKGDS